MTSESAPECDDSGAHFLHADMDSFYASVEVLDHPEWRGRPVIVAGESGRAVVSSASYEARRFGVRSAMPVGQAKRLCPQAIVVPVRMGRYREESRRVMEIFRSFTPLVEPLSIDEAFLDVSGARRLLGSPAQIAAALRARVRSETGLPVSVGVAGTMFVAKVASARAKPDGLLVVPVADTLAFLHPLPVSVLWGVGSATRQALADLGLVTVGDVAATPRETLERRLGAVGGKLSRLANGIDERDIELGRVTKSIGHETTFERDLAHPDDLRRELLRLSTATATGLRASGVAARTIALTLRFADFQTVTRSRTLPEPTAVGKRIYDVAALLLESAWRPVTRVRLLGVRGENLTAEPNAQALWDPDEGWRGAERAGDDIAARFGRDALKPASLTAPPPHGDQHPDSHQ